MSDGDAHRYLREAAAFLRAARILHLEWLRPDAANQWDELINPTYFSLLHSTELAIKSIGLFRGMVVPRSHNIVRLSRDFAVKSDRDNLRNAYRSTRTLIEERIKDRWSGLDGDYASAGEEIEIDGSRRKHVGLIKNFKTLGRLGQSEETKYEFNEKVEDWWHGARYPSAGFTTYPDFEVCALMCEELIRVAKEEQCNDGA